MFQIIQQSQANQKNPQDLFKEITKNYKPEQLDNLFNKAREFGITDDVINKLR